jgi:hypothetical protein
MITENSDMVALTAQADIHRLYVKVIQPALAEFAPTVDVDIVGETTDIDQFLEHARINTHNSLCHELRRTFALILGALFERQLRFWLSEKMPAKKKNVETAKWPKLIKLVNCVDRSVTTNPVITDLEDLWLVANAVRHGNGRSAETLLQKKPDFWSQTEKEPHVKRDLIGKMRINDAQLELYARAIMRFWHLAGASPFPE